MQNILLILYPWQQTSLNLQPQINVTIALNYNNLDIPSFNIIIDCTEQWSQIEITPNTINKVLFFIHQPLITNQFLLPNFIRFNAWPTFFHNATWEFSGVLQSLFKTIIQNVLGKTLLKSSDVTGLISGSIIAGIINEAYNALENNVGTKADIDTAMKLGTNYPYGPFEWAQKIGIENIYNLLLAKQAYNPYYTPNKLMLNP